MHDITPCWLSKGRSVMNKKRKTMLARGDTRCNWPVLCASQCRKCLNGNVFHMKSPDKLPSLIIKFSFYSHSEFKILQPERSMCSLSLTMEGCKNERSSYRWSSITQSLIKHTPLSMHARNIRLSLKWGFSWNKYKFTMILRPQLWSIQPGGGGGGLACAQQKLSWSLNQEKSEKSLHSPLMSCKVFWIII